MEFVDYLNTLHNCKAQNENSFSEKNVTNQFYADTSVEMGITGEICKILESEEPQIVILTGHAGDGKTNILYQVLEKFGVLTNRDKPEILVHLSTGKECLCIKDFSELSDNTKVQKMKEILQYPSQGKSVFMVANTGPLINAFKKAFESKERQEEAVMQLINNIDRNSGDASEQNDGPSMIMGYPITVINMASIDNTDFPSRFLDKVCQDKLWVKCQQCPHAQLCHIYKNKKLITEHADRIKDFIRMFYIWQNENGERMTIRSMVEHLSFMITGGVSCETAKRNHLKLDQLLFSNSFFGYIGEDENSPAQTITAVRKAFESELDSKPLRIDEDLLIRRDYEGIFKDEIVQVLTEGREDYQDRNKLTIPWTKEIRRAYFFMNNLSDEDPKWINSVEDIFSAQFMNYLKVRDGKSTIRSLKKLIMAGLRMMYYGSSNSRERGNEIPITYSKYKEISKNVQMVIGSIKEKQINLETQHSSMFNTKVNHVYLYLGKAKQKSKEKVRLSLPMINYFDDLRTGTISTSVNPLLSHGIESLKALILEFVKKNADEDFEENEMELLLLDENETKRLEFYFDDKGNLSLEEGND